MSPKTRLATALLLLSAVCASAADNPSRKLRPVPFTEVRLTDSFWAPRIEVNRQKTVPHNIATCEGTGRIANFARAGGLEEGAFQGIYFNDSDVYKMIEGVSYTLASRRDPELEARLDGIIAKIAAAQWEDGYLNTYYTLVEKGKRWTDLPAKHELYCAGHLFEAAVAHWRATGKRTLLDVACRLADHIDRMFGPGKKAGVSGHEEIELALVKLHEATEEPRYLRLAQHFIDERGRANGRALYGEYCQDHLPVREQGDIVGHAVRATYLYSGVADVASYTGDAGLIGAMDRLWRSVTTRKMYVTGGIGPSASNEGFTVDYDLPNESAYAETCASIGMALWSHRLFLLHGEGRFADVFEQVVYNGLLSGIALDGERFFYVNPLASRGKHHRQPWFDCACCPTNVVRFLPSVGGYFYALSEGVVWAILYASSEASLTVSAAGGATCRVRLAQETIYPWSGDVKLRVDPEQPAAFTLQLRIPRWCQGAVASVNGAPVEARVEHGFLPLVREWRAGDRVELHLPMTVDRLEAHPAVQGNLGRVALRRGPVVYCLEAVDNGGRVSDLALPRDANLEAFWLSSFPGGAMVLHGRGQRASAGEWEDVLYRDAATVPSVEITAVPYHAWDNRAPGEMVVWIPETAALAGASAPKPTSSAR